MRLDVVEAGQRRLRMVLASLGVSNADSLHNLAASRLNRVSRRDMVHVHDTMQKRMMELMAEGALEAENGVD